MNRLLLRLGCLWLRSLRVHWTSPCELPERAMIVLWHEHLPVCIRVFSDRGIRVLISKSADGDWAAEACERFGYRVHRGSTSRGGSAGLRALARGLETGTGSAGMALDGPRGPRREIKPGALWLSQSIEIPVVPVFIRAQRAFRLRSWDRCLVPFPFSKVEVRVGRPLLPLGTEDILRAMDALERGAAAIPISPKDIYIATR